MEAQEALEKANGAKDKAVAEEKASDEALATTVQAAVVEVKTCQCKAKAAYKTATAAANENAVADAAAYTKGKHMLCVLEGATDLSKCDVGTVPTPTTIKLASDTASAECEEAACPCIKAGSTMCNLIDADCQLCPPAFPTPHAGFS